jgi:glycosyltransferase involved in cell wall biosynthesis
VKILFANKFFFMKGGSERVFFQERSFLKDIGVKVIDFSMEDPRNLSSEYSNCFVSSIDYHCTQSILGKMKGSAKFIHSPEAVSKLERLVQYERPNIAHLHNIYHHLTPSVISVLKKHDVKVLLTLHDGKLICPGYLMLDKGKVCTVCEGRSFWKPLVTNCTGSIMQGLLLMLEAYWHKWIGSYGQVDLFLSPSRFLAELVSQRVAREKIRVLHNGIDLKSCSPSSSDNGYALYFGRLSREKGIESLLRAHRSIKGSLPLKVVGTGPLESTLRESYPNTDFLGYEEGEELNRIIAESAFVVVPSEWHENCSMVVLEAMALGKPIIGSRIGGIPEQIDDGKTGLLFEMGNVEELSEKMKSLSKSPDVRKRMGAAARKKLEREYSLEAHCAGLMNTYEELLSKN